MPQGAEHVIQQKLPGNQRRKFPREPNLSERACKSELNVIIDDSVVAAYARVVPKRGQMTNRLVVFVLVIALRAAANGAVQQAEEELP